MCHSFRETEKTEFTGYKVVLLNERTGRYHSLLTGNVYPKSGKIPIWISQHNRKTNFYDPYILPQGCKQTHDSLIHRKNGSLSYPCWTHQMVGRTTVYRSKIIAKTYLRYVKSITDERGIREGYRPVLIKAKLSKNLFEARYDRHIVFCGKNMEILEEEIA